MKTHSIIKSLSGIFLLSLISISFSACQHSGTNDEFSDNDTLTTCQNAPTELTNELIKEIIGYIPDHSMDNSPAEAFTQEYYDWLTKAWAVPSDNPDGIGSEEWLYYFISGNGETYNDINIRSVEVKGDKAIVVFDCIWNQEYKDQKEHTLNLVFDGNRWLIEDYDNTLQELKEYVESNQK